jgi:uncharacterized membrane protein YdjX (TVP38/TMEM64 family)
MITVTPLAAGRAPHKRPHARQIGAIGVLAVVLKTVNTVVNTLRGVRAAVLATAAAVSARRFFAILAAIVILVAVALLVPLPTAVQLRDWATSVGPWFPLAFLGAHIVVTVFPFPRTAFTLAAGLLFGPLLGIPLAVLAATISAVIALLLVRAAGWQLNRLVRHPRVDSLDARLQQRGWLTILSMRLIPAMPFSVVNYAAGASAVRLLPYTLATLVGLLPGTAAVVILGDALTGNISPALLLVSVCTAAVGFVGLIYEIRVYRRHHRERLAVSAPERAASAAPRP